MVKSTREELRSKTYGLPLYCAAWVPLDQISPPPEAATTTANEPAEETDGGDKILHTTEGDVAGEVVADSPKSPSNGNHLLLALGGGGGEGRSGVPNAVLLTLFDLDSRSLSDHPVQRVGTEGEVPYRMAMHPRGDGIVCSFPNSCRLFEWDISKSMEPRKLSLKCSGITLKQLTDVGLQLALTFSSDGTSLAAGGEDGHLRVFKWPSMDIFLDKTDAHTTIKHLDFSSNGKYLVAIGERGCCKIWNLASSTTLTVVIGEGFSFCRFSQDNDALYFTTIHGEIGKIISGSAFSFRRMGSKKIARDPISAFSGSHDGKLLAIGTIEGDVAIINSSNFKVQLLVKKAHLGLVTALAFSHDSRFLVSTSFDSTARVTVIEDRKESWSSLWLSVLVILLAILFYFIKFQWDLRKNIRTGFNVPGN